MRAVDLSRLHEWLQRPHVRRWWREGETYEEVVEHYLPSIEGREPTQLYLIALEARPVGFIQTYLVSDYPEWETLVRVGASVLPPLGISVTSRSHGTPSQSFG